MAFQAGAITSTLGLDISPFRQGMLQATSIAQIFPQTVTNFIASPLLGVMGIASQVGSAIKGALEAGIGSGIRLAAQFEQAEVAFGTMLGSAAAAKSVLADLEQFAAETPFEFPELIGAARRLTGLGVEVSDLIGTMRMLGDVSAGTSQPIGEISIIYGQVLNKGRLMGEEVLQFAERGIPLTAQLAAQYGVTTGELTKMITAGQVGFADFRKALEAMVSDGGKFHDMMADQAKTTTGLWSNLKDIVGFSLRGIGQEILDAFDVKGGIAGLTAGIRSAQPEVLAVARTLAEGLAGPIRDDLLPRLASIATWMRDNPVEMRATIGSAVDAIVGFMNKAITVAGFVIEHIEGIARVLGAFVLGSAVRSAVGFLGSLIGQLTTLRTAFATTSAAAAAANLTPGGGLGGGFGGAGMSRALTAGVVSAAVTGWAGAGTFGQVGSAVGGAIGSAAAAKLGAMAGSIAGPIGIALGAIVGTIFGAAIDGVISSRQLADQKIDDSAKAGTLALGEYNESARETQRIVSGLSISMMQLGDSGRIAAEAAKQQLAPHHEQMRLAMDQLRAADRSGDVGGRTRASQRVRETVADYESAASDIIKNWNEVLKEAEGSQGGLAKAAADAANLAKESTNLPPVDPAMKGSIDDLYGTMRRASRFVQTDFKPGLASIASQADASTTAIGALKRIIDELATSLQTVNLGQIAADATAAAGISAGGGAGAGAGGAGGVTIERVEFGSIDGHKVADDIAKALWPQVQAEIGRQQLAADTAAGALRARRGLGG